MPPSIKKSTFDHYIACKIFFFKPYNGFVWFQKESELDKLVSEEANIKNSVRDLRQKVEEARSSLAINKSRGKVLEALIQQKKSGKIPGIHGRLVS